jgi:hypothetical protein
VQFIVDVIQAASEYYQELTAEKYSKRNQTYEFVDPLCPLLIAM